MNYLATPLRRQLEKTVVEARSIAEIGARKALEALAVHRFKPYGHMSPEQRRLRRRLLAHAPHLGDTNDGSGGRTIDKLVGECAYHHWLGMLFGSFLARNNLLIEPETGVAITLDECEELAKEEEEDTDKWLLAARFAHSMLPQVFRPDNPVLEVRLAREHQLKLEGMAESLAPEVFAASDALGWVYQFWQKQEKDRINRSNDKIGANELPAVTQLFTEPYMVQFLLDNSLGAWWVSRHPDKPAPIELAYLRRISGGGQEIPAGGTYADWPDHLSEFRFLDPCCGSGHFLVTAFQMLVPMRMALEDMQASEAVDAVLRDNIHGLEIDKRCVAIAAFALALEAWRYPGTEGFRPLPKPRIAWSGQPVAGTKEQWLALAGSDTRMESGMGDLYEAFQNAPLLGSLIDPGRSISDDFLTATAGELQPMLEEALPDHLDGDEWEETAVAARGLAEAARLLTGRYHLVATNVPYLGSGKMSEELSGFCRRHYPKAKGDLANVFLERCLELSRDNGVGVTQIVMPENWLFLVSYKQHRKHLLENMCWKLVVQLGEGGFDNSLAAAILFSLACTQPSGEHRFRGIDASESRTVSGKAEECRSGEIISISQTAQLANPDAKVILDDIDVRNTDMMETYAFAHQGLATGDYLCFGRKFWELSRVQHPWRFQQGTVKETVDFGGRENVVHWGKKGQVYLERRKNVRIQGGGGFGKIEASLFHKWAFCRLRVTRASCSTTILPPWDH